MRYFERARFEYHPEHADTEHEVLLGQFGRAIQTADPLVAARSDCNYFNQTGHK